MDHAGLGVDLPLGAHHASLPGVLGPREVRAQLDRRTLGVGSVVAVPEREIQEGELVVRDGEADLREVGGVEPRHRRAAVHELTDVGVRSRTRPVKGARISVRSRSRSAFSRLARAWRRAARATRSAVTAMSSLAGLAICLSARLLLSLELLRLALQLTLGPRQVGARELEGDPVVERVDAHQGVVRLEESAGGEGRGHPNDGARHLGDEIALGARRDGAVGGDPELDRLWRDVDDADQPRQRLGRVGLDVRARGHQGDGAEHAGDHDRDGQQELETAFHGAEYRGRRCTGQALAAPLPRCS